LHLTSNAGGAQSGYHICRKRGESERIVRSREQTGEIAPKIVNARETPGVVELVSIV